MIVIVEELYDVVTVDGGKTEVRYQRLIAKYAIILAKKYNEKSLRLKWGAVAIVRPHVVKRRRQVA